MCTSFYADSHADVDADTNADGNADPAALWFQRRRRRCGPDADVDADSNADANAVLATPMSRAFTSNVHLMDIKRPSDVTSKVRSLFDVIVSADFADIKRRAAFDLPI